MDKKNLLFNNLWCDLLVEIVNHARFRKSIKNYILIDNNMNKMFDIFYIYYIIFTKILIVNKHITKYVNLFLKKYNYNSFSGLQIRVGNEDLKEKQYLYKNDTDIIIKILKKNNKQKKWFITGDSQRLKLQLCKICKNIIVYTTNITNHYKKNKKDSTIIIEHEILTKSQYFIISKSSYGLTAVLKSGLLTNSYEDLCFEIKKGRLYNIVDEFNSFYE